MVQGRQPALQAADIAGNVQAEDLARPIPEELVAAGQAFQQHPVGLDQRPFAQDVLLRRNQHPARVQPRQRVLFGSAERFQNVQPVDEQVEHAIIRG